MLIVSNHTHKCYSGGLSPKVARYEWRGDCWLWQGRVGAPGGETLVKPQNFSPGSYIYTDASWVSSPPVCFTNRNVTEDGKRREREEGSKLLVNPGKEVVGEREVTRNELMSRRLSSPTATDSTRIPVGVGCP